MDSPNNPNSNNPNPFSPLPSASSPPAPPPPPPFAPPPTPSQSDTSSWPGTAGWPPAATPNPLPEMPASPWTPPPPITNPTPVSNPLEPMAPTPPSPLTQNLSPDYSPIAPLNSSIDASPSPLTSTESTSIFAPSDQPNLPTGTPQFNSALDNPWNAPIQPPPLGNPPLTTPPTPITSSDLSTATPTFTPTNPTPVEATTQSNTWPPVSPSNPVSTLGGETTPQSYTMDTPANPESSPNTEPAPAAPTDFSHLISSNPPETPPPAEETLVAPLPVPEIPTVPSENHKSIPKWLIGLGVGLLIIVTGASAYFILGIGQPAKTTTSIPATQVSKPTVKTPPPIATPITQPAATGSANFGQLQSNTVATSAADLLRRNQQQGR